MFDTFNTEKFRIQHLNSKNLVETQNEAKINIQITWNHRFSQNFDFESNFLAPGTNINLL